jgi:cation transport protein ChaC
MTLTRAFLENDELRKSYERHHPELPVVPRHEFDASLERVLAEVEPGRDLWLFGYGSLIWNPLFRPAERWPASLRGFHRRFCLWSRMGRGSPDQPGLMLALEHGGCCHGIALRIPARDLRHELTLIWRREMTLGSYVPRWVRLVSGGTSRRALAFAVNRRGSQYAGRLPDERVVQVLASARGRLGTGADYLFRTVSGLRAAGVRDSHLEQLAVRVRQWQGQSEDCVDGSGAAA